MLTDGFVTFPFQQGIKFGVVCNGNPFRIEAARLVEQTYVHRFGWLLEDSEVLQKDLDPTGRLDCSRTVVGVDGNEKVIITLTLFTSCKEVDGRPLRFPLEEGGLVLPLRFCDRTKVAELGRFAKIPEAREFLGLGVYNLVVKLLEASDLRYLIMTVNWGVLSDLWLAGIIPEILGPPESYYGAPESIFAVIDTKYAFELLAISNPYALKCIGIGTKYEHMKFGIDGIRYFVIALYSTIKFLGVKGLKIWAIQLKRQAKFVAKFWSKRIRKFLNREWLVKIDMGY